MFEKYCLSSYPKVMLYLYLAVLVLLLLAAYTSISAAPWLPTRKVDVDKLLEDANLHTGSQFIELGCGDGRVVKAAAKKGAIALGYELNPVLFLIAWVNNLGVNNAKIKFRNLWTVDLSGADVVMAFMTPRTLPRLDAKLKAELKPSAIFISYVFAIEGRQPIKKAKSWSVYSYKTKPRVKIRQHNRIY